MSTTDWSAGRVFQQPISSVRACNCIGPQRGEPVCPCMMPAHTHREKERQALQTLLALQGRKPRFRVPAGRSPA